MSQSAIFWPVIAQAVLTYAIYALISVRRRAAVLSGEAKNAQFRENQNEPASSLFVRNNLANQFELPVLFFAACLALHAVGAAGSAAVVLAWLFVATRWVHAYVHVTSNRLRYRRPAFALGYLVLAFMWVLLAVHLATA